MTPAEIIAQVRTLIQDTREPLRYTDDQLLGYVNESLKITSVLRPDLFSDIVEIPTDEASAVQELPTDAFRLIDIFQVKDGGAVLETDRETMSRNHPLWMMEASGQPVNFMRHVKNPTRFFLYPRPAAGVVLIGEFARTPPTYTLNEDIVQPSAAYYSALVHCTVYLAESVDNEHVSSGRAKLFYDSFVQQLATGLQSRTITDTKAAAMGKSRETSIKGEVI